MVCICDQGSDRPVTEGSLDDPICVAGWLTELRTTGFLPSGLCACAVKTVTNFLCAHKLGQCNIARSHKSSKGIMSLCIVVMHISKTVV